MSVGDSFGGACRVCPCIGKSAKTHERMARWRLKPAMEDPTGLSSIDKSGSKGKFQTELISRDVDWKKQAKFKDGVR